MDSSNILSLACDEYTNQLCNELNSCIYVGIQSLWETSKKLPDSKSILMNYQKQLSMIPKWNQDIIENEYNRITKQIEISKLEKIVEAVFLCNIKSSLLIFLLFKKTQSHCIL